MKTILILLISLLSTISIYSQARIGYTFDELTTEFEGTYTSGYPEYAYLHIEHETANIFYSFDENKYCYEVLVMPKTEEDIKFYFNRYTNDLKKLSSTQWVLVGDGLNVYYSFLIDKEGNGFFKITK